MPIVADTASMDNSAMTAGQREGLGGCVRTAVRGPVTAGLSLMSGFRSQGVQGCEQAGIVRRHCLINPL